MLGLAAAVVVLIGMGRISSIVGTVFLALVLVICAHPVKTWLVRHKTPVALATMAAILTVYAAIGVLVAAVWYSAVQFTKLLPQFAPQIADHAAQLQAFARDTLGLDSDQAFSLVHNLDPRVLLETAAHLLGSIMNVGTGTIFLLLLVMFMSVDAIYFPSLLKAVRTSRPDMVAALEKFAGLSRRFMVMTAIFGAIVAVLNLVLLLIVGVPGAGLWAMLAFVCGFIPFIGFWISLVPAAIMALLAGGLPAFIAVVVFYGVINSLIQSVIQPKFVAGSMNLNMTLTFLSVIFFSGLLGPLGALMAVPLALFARAILVDSHPGAAWLRPFLGEVAGAKEPPSGAGSEDAGSAGAGSAGAGSAGAGSAAPEVPGKPAAIADLT